MQNSFKTLCPGIVAPCLHGSDDKPSILGHNVYIEEEIWKDIPGYKGYQASNIGRIRTLDRFDTYGIGRFIKGKIKSQSTSKQGYKRVGVSVTTDKQRTKFVHQMVAKAFILNPQNKKYVNHIDGNKKNNRVENLEWVTGKENIIHSYKNGLQKPSDKQKKIARYFGKLNGKKVIQMDLDGNVIGEYYSAHEAARQTGFSNSRISSCCRGEISIYQNYKFNYA